MNNVKTYVVFFWIVSIVFLGFFLQGTSEITYDRLAHLTRLKHPFLYDLHPRVLQGTHNKAPVMIICHGYGDNYSLASHIYKLKVTNHHLVGFNFPDHDITDRDDHTKSSLGTFQEILPLIYLIKICVIDFKLSQISLYGFSAGGGAVLNALAALYTKVFDTELSKFGIGQTNKQLMMNALQAGVILLDCPLKSIEEIMDFRGKNVQFQAIALHYDHNKMRPLDMLSSLQGIAVTLFLHFQNPDEILSNRDDKLFIERLRRANRGSTFVTSSNEGGHNKHHAALWKSFKKHI